MTHQIESKLDVLAEIIKRIESDVSEVKEKVTIQNGNVARIKEWVAVHDEQAESRTRHISNNETSISKLREDLQPVLTFIRYPIPFGIGVTLMFIAAMAGIYHSVAMFVDFK